MSDDVESLPITCVLGDGAVFLVGPELERALHSMFDRSPFDAVERDGGIPTRHEFRGGDMGGRKGREILFPALLITFRPNPLSSPTRKAGRRGRPLAVQDRLNRFCHSRHSHHLLLQPE